MLLDKFDLDLMMIHYYLGFFFNIQLSCNIFPQFKKLPSFNSFSKIRVRLDNISKFLNWFPDFFIFDNILSALRFMPV